MAWFAGFCGERHSDLLKERGPTSLLKALDLLQPKTPEGCAAVATAGDYFKLHTAAGRMDYPGFIAEGLPIASGIVESGCNSVACRRTKGPASVGAAWAHRPSSIYAASASVHPAGRPSCVGIRDHGVLLWLRSARKQPEMAFLFLPFPPRKKCGVPLDDYRICDIQDDPSPHTSAARPLSDSVPRKCPLRRSRISPSGVTVMPAHPEVGQGACPEGQGSSADHR